MKSMLRRGAAVALLFTLPAGCGGRKVESSAPSGPQQPIELVWDQLPASATARDGASPMSLTASDGTGIELVELGASAVVEGPLAFTELRFVFENPSPRTLEGTFSVVLPETASVLRFAMAVGGVLQEGEIVEQKKAEQTFETFLHRRVDPALLEHGAGNRFRARVFPIAANERKEIVLSYSEVLRHTTDPYRIHLQGLPTLDKLDVRVAVARTGAEQRRIYHLERELFTPDRDFVLPQNAMSDAPAVARSGNLAAVRINTQPSRAKLDPIGELTILVDTSASRFGDLAEQVRELRELVGGLATKENPKLSIMCFDQELFEVFSGRASDFGKAHQDAILQRGAGGATDLSGALAALGSSARAVVLSDGLGNVGLVDVTSIAERLKQARVPRLDFALMGAAYDGKLAERLASSGMRAGTLLGKSLGSAPVGERLRRLGPSSLQIGVSGSRFSFPEQLSPAEAGDEAVVFAELAESGPIEVLVNGEPQVFETSHSTSPELLERALGRAKIDKLMLAYGSAQESIKDRIRRRVVSLAQRHGVLGPFTSLLVLESEEQYGQFGIDRKGPSRFLTIGENGGLKLESRQRGALPETGGSSWSTGPGEASRPRSNGQADDDRDQIPNERDQCPNDPETYNGHRDEDGCPDRGLVLIEDSNLVILEAIRFESGTARLRPESQPIVDAVVDVMKNHLEFFLLEIGGHTDDRGTPAKNLALSEQRALAVLDAMVRGGIHPSRLLARGYGGTCPRADNATADGRERNRRVEFKILETQEGPTGVHRCKAVPGARDLKTSVKPHKNALQPPPRVRPPGRGIRLQAPPMHGPSPVDGEYGRVRKLLDEQRIDEALHVAASYRDQDPRADLAWVALGDCYLAKGDFSAAARAYGSLIDLEGDAANRRRAAGGLLETIAARVKDRDATLANAALALATDAYRKALEQRPDHPSSHRLLGFALAKQGKLSEAMTLLEGARALAFAPRFGHVRAIFDADLGMLAAAWAAQAPDQKEALERRLGAIGVRLSAEPKVRFVLSWESDTSDVDLFVRTRERILHSKQSPSDVRDGFGPEAIELREPQNEPLQLAASLVLRGFQGHVLGKVAIVEYDGKGGLRFDERPFVLMVDRGFAALGEYTPQVR